MVETKISFERVKAQRNNSFFEQRQLRPCHAHQLHKTFSRGNTPVIRYFDYNVAESDAQDTALVIVTTSISAVGGSCENFEAAGRKQRLGSPGSIIGDIC
jgi:hypothetical protein